MLTLDQLQQQKRTAILQIAAKYHAINLRVFGSVARGEATQSSDVDFLVDLPPGQSLLKRIALQQELEDLLGCPVDVVKPSNLRPSIRELVLQEAIAL
ncbi:nucleotidyltransferase family protein [Spirulina sp. CCNP1310]|uniref:nucleotidyltransferase family protein n=1 Tax=Spirulina sp. CCNP1310 TaxID=3110249 RepID=UPI002B21A78B|nr:nucleotidyltransferase family protein [Spirulina sp. CCNP1310]MEA5419536.1 nucleotidyltransferase family protein [Spirulina sp. CCNP1310]